MPKTLLIVRGVEAGYRNRQILFGVDLDVREGEAVVLLGANGSGKSTLLNAISGFVRPRRGSIRLDGAELAGRRLTAYFVTAWSRCHKRAICFPKCPLRRTCASVLGCGVAPPHPCWNAFIIHSHAWPRGARSPCA